MMKFVESEIRIRSNPERILEALLDPEQLKLWWAVDDAFIQKKDGGLYTLVWMKTEAGMKFISTGKIKLFNFRSHLELEDMMYLNSEKPIIGPCSIRYDVVAKSNYSMLKVKQSGFKKGKDWNWYYKAVTDGWPQALVFLKKYLEAN